MNKLITEPGPGEAAALDPTRHRRKCFVCKHPDRDAIEEEFLDWRSPQAIGADYGIHKNSIYCHAHAMGLFARRRGNIRSALELLIEQVEHAKVTGDTIINAVRALTCLQDDGRWVEPPRRVIYSIESSPAANSPPVHAGQQRDAAGRFVGVTPPITQDPSQSDEFLIVSPEIRNRANSTETKEEVKV